MLVSDVPLVEGYSSRGHGCYGSWKDRDVEVTACFAMVSCICEDQARMSMASSSKCGRDGGSICNEFLSKQLECFISGSAHDLLYFRMGEVVRHIGYVFRHMWYSWCGR